MRMSMPLKSSFPLQRQQLFQQQQMMLMMLHQAAAAGRIHPGHPLAPAASAAGLDLRHPPPSVRGGPAGGDGDEYNGLMTQREKDWIIKIQLLQLHTDNPYVDDYYYTVGIGDGFGIC